MTKFPDVFAGLCAKFAEGEVKTRPQGNQKLSYVTARVVMNRLDDVLGPENWWDEYFPMEHSVLCKLSIRLPDGSVLCKSDAGGYAGMTDQGDDDKSGFSDSFKRAAVKFGVGRYLYRDGVPSFKPAPEIAPRQAKPHPVAPAPDVHHAKHFGNDTGHGSGTYASPETVKAFLAWAREQCEEVNAKWLDFLTDKDGEIRKGPSEVINPFQLAAHLVNWGRENGHLNAPVDTRSGTRDKYAAIVWERHRAPTEAEALDKCRKEWAAARAKLKPQREPGDDPTEDEHEALDKLVAEGKVPA